MTALAGRIRAIPGWQVTLGVALLGLGFLIAAQLASEGPRIRYTSQERTPLVETVLNLQAQQEGLKAAILQQRSAIQDLEAAGQGGAAVTRDLNAELESARIAAGMVPLRGPGVVIQLADSKAAVPADANERDYLVSGLDVLTVAEELWLAGAQAMAVNGERLTVATAIVDIGGSVLVNSAYVAPPYQLAAIGPADMVDRLTRSAGFAEFMRARSETFGIGVASAQSEAVDLPAYGGSVNLRYARPVPSAAPGASSTPDASPGTVR